MKKKSQKKVCKGTAKTREEKPGEVLRDAGSGQSCWPVLPRGQIRCCCLQVCGHLVQPGLGGALGLKPASSESRGKERQDWSPQEKRPLSKCVCEQAEGQVGMEIWMGSRAELFFTF